MLDRTNSMFEYRNLPDTIPAYILELYLQIFGSCAFVQIDDATPITNPERYPTPPGLYIFYGNIGGERDIYYRPTQFIVANPRLKNSINCPIIYASYQTESFSNPCIVMRNDTNYMGLLPLFSRYAAQLTENDISIRSAQINARAQTGIAVGTDSDAESARKYFDDLESGKIGIIGKMSFLEGITMSNIGTQSSNCIIQLIELQQYLKASWYNELGLNVNFNMKREYMSEEEIAVNTDILLPLVDDMFKCRQEAIDLINLTFNLNITVEKSSAWANKEQEELNALYESAQKGDTPLHENIVDRVNDSTSVSQLTTSQNENPKIQTEIPSNTETQENAGEQLERPTGDAPNVDITININADESKVTENDNQSETQEKPDESDDT